MTTAKCSVCKRPESEDDPKSELRPYGENGAPICFSCGTSPRRVKETKRQLGKLFDAADPVSILTSDGPKPFRSKGSS